MDPIQGGLTKSRYQKEGLKSKRRMKEKNMYGIEVSNFKTTVALPSLLLQPDTPAVGSG